MANYEFDIVQGATVGITIQPEVGGQPSSNAENPVYVENGSTDLEVTPVSNVAPFTANVKAVGGIGQNPLLRVQFDGHQGPGETPIEALVQFHITAPDAESASVTIGPAF